MAVKVLTKQPAESLLFDMDFSDDMLAGDTIASIDSITITPSGTLTKSGEVASGQIAQAMFHDGADGVRYKVRFQVTTTLGETLEGDGELLVAEKE